MDPITTTVPIITTTIPVITTTTVPTPVTTVTTDIATTIATTTVSSTAVAVSTTATSAISRTASISAPTVTSSTSPTNAPNVSDPNASGSSAAIIAGSVIGGVVALALLGFAIFVFRIKRQDKRQRPPFLDSTPKLPVDTTNTSAMSLANMTAPSTVGSASSAVGLNGRLPSETSHLLANMQQQPQQPAFAVMGGNPVNISAAGAYLVDDQQQQSVKQAEYVLVDANGVAVAYAADGTPLYNVPYPVNVENNPTATSNQYF